MFDRVLDITNELQKQGYDKNLAERMVLLYRDHGISSVLNHLTTEAKWTREKALLMGKEIDKRYTSTNRQILIFYTALVLVLILLVWYGIYASFYFLLLLSGVLLISRAITLFRFIWKNRFKNDAFSNESETVSVK